MRHRSTPDHEKENDIGEQDLPESKHKDGRDSTLDRYNTTASEAEAKQQPNSAARPAHKSTAPKSFANSQNYPSAMARSRGRVMPVVTRAMKEMNIDKALKECGGLPPYTDTDTDTQTERHTRRDAHTHTP